MLANTVQHHEENDDELDDIEALRKIAMESIKKKAKEDQQNNYSMFHNQQPFASHSFPSARPPRMQHYNPHYGGPPQNLMNYPAVPYHHPRSQPIIHQEFTPIPHVNPHFMSQPQMFPNDYPPSIGMEFMPTPAVRLSPRSLEFVESNKKALMNANTKRSKSPVSRRRYSRESRSRSRSPVKRRSSRSPYNKRRSPHENNRNKRFRSKSPNNRNYKPRRMSSEKDVTAKSPNRSQTNRYNKKGRETRYNNGNKFNRKRSESDKDDESNISPLKSSQSDKEIENIKEELTGINQLNDTESLTFIVEESTTPPPPTQPIVAVNRVKSQEEIENELLASSDDDEPGLDIGVDENDLDFLNMDDSESENEGRFKDKPSTNVVKKQPTSLNNKNSLYSSKPFDKSRSYRNRDDRFRRRDHGSRKNSPEYRRSSPERKRSPKSIKEDDKPLFKPTFKSVESSDEKKNDDAKKSEKQSSIIRSAVMKAESNSKLSKKSSSTVKSTIAANDESSKASEPRKKKILDRLGGYIGGKAKSSSKQVIKKRRHKPQRRQVVISLKAVSG